MEYESTGGPAFPSKKRVYRQGYPTNEFEPVAGMTLRDYFAANALQGMCFGDRWPAHNEFNEIAKRAYGLADAMLEARKS